MTKTNIKEKENFKKHIYRRFIKRPLDLILSLMTIIILSPIFIIVGVLVRFKIGSPVLFKQKRPGINEKIFTMYKFRTMTDEKDENGELLPDSVRLTRFGRMLRSTSLDELPELFNILRGDMSIVGPRPLLIRYLPYYFDYERQRSDVRPGITGLAQVSGRNTLTWNERFAIDVEYVKKLSFLNDLKIILRTVLVVFQKKDILVGDEHVIFDLDVERSGLCKMEYNKEDIDIEFVSEAELNENSKEIIELLNDNYLINFSNNNYFLNFAISNFNDMKKYINNGSAIVVGAYLEEQVIGLLWAYKRLFLGKETLHINHIVVKDTFRGYGIGSRMIDFIEQYALKNEIKTIELLTTSTNEKTIKFYNKHGFKITRVQFEKVLGEKDDN